MDGERFHSNENTPASTIPRPLLGKSLLYVLTQQQQQEIQKTGLSVLQSPSLTNIETLKVATVVQQIMTELSEAVSEEDKIMVIIKMVLTLMKPNGC
jgi:hypothetical protein